MYPRKPPISIPTWRGYVETTRDALRIFEACFNGVLPFCSCRTRDHERIVSGNVFVYDETSSGIKRWTDGVTWSPSRMLTNFLIYRQLDDQIPSGERKRAKKKNDRAREPDPDSTPSVARSTTNKVIPLSSPGSPAEQKEGKVSDAETERRRLVGSLVDSYEFKADGLLKKTMTVTVNDRRYHLVAYYSINDAKHYLKTPRDDPSLKNLQIRDALLNQLKFTAYPDNPGDGNFDETQGLSGLYFNHRQNEYDPSPTRVAEFHQVGPGGICPTLAYQCVYTPMHPPPASESSPATFPHTMVTYCQQPGVFACNAQDTRQPQRWSYQLPESRDYRSNSTYLHQQYAVPRHTGPFALQAENIEPETAAETKGIHYPHYQALQMEAARAMDGM